MVLAVRVSVRDPERKVVKLRNSHPLGKILACMLSQNVFN